jgi:hypothetical protein
MLDHSADARDRIASKVLISNEVEVAPARGVGV